MPLVCCAIALLTKKKTSFPLLTILWRPREPCWHSRQSTWAFLWTPSLTSWRPRSWIQCTSQSTLFVVGNKKRLPISKYRFGWDVEVVSPFSVLVLRRVYILAQVWDEFLFVANRCAGPCGERQWYPEGVVFHGRNGWSQLLASFRFVASLPLLLPLFLALALLPASCSCSCSWSFIFVSKRSVTERKHYPMAAGEWMQQQLVRQRILMSWVPTLSL